MESLLKIIGIVGLVFLALVISPFLTFWLAYFGGWLAQITIGGILVSGLQTLGLSISVNQIPLIAGTLGWIGCFFKNSRELKWNND